MKELISIIVPVYNVDDYLEKCLNSLINQIYKEIEIILIDDGSTDKSGEICDRYAKKDKRIIVIHQKNQGVSAARNKGLEIATGKYIGFVDSDDYIQKDMYEKMIKIYKVNKVELVICNVLKGNSDFYYKKNKTMNKTEALTDILKDDGFQGYLCNKLYLKSIIDKNNLRLNQNIHICEDVVFNCEYINRINRLHYFNEKLYVYELRENSASNVKKINQKWLTILEAYKSIEKIYREKDKKLYSDFLLKLIYETLRVKIEMSISNIKNTIILKECNAIIDRSINQLKEYKTISKTKILKIKIKTKTYRMISFLKQIKRRTL